MARPSGGLVEVSLECDACRCAATFSGVPVEDVADQINTAGWLTNTARDLDVCPACVVNRVLAVGRNVSGVLL